MSCFTSFRALILVGYQPNDKERCGAVGTTYYLTALRHRLNMPP